MEGAGPNAGLIDTLDWKDLPQIGAKLTFRNPPRVSRYEVIDVEHIYDVRRVLSDPELPAYTYETVPAHVIVTLMDLDRADRGG